MRTSNRLAAVFSTALLISGCAAVSTGNMNESGRTWLRDGALALSRPVPDATSVSAASDPVLGFMPSRHSQVGRWLRIDRANKRIELLDGPSVLSALSGDGIQSLKPGTYSVVHKQQSPLWYAPNVYFEARLLSVPSTSNSERYRRGALGTSAIFLDANTPIHDGPIWREEIGGVRVDEDQMAKLFKLRDVGSVVEIK